MLNKIKNNKIGGTIIEKDREDVGGRGGGGTFSGSRLHFQIWK